LKRICFELFALLNAHAQTQKKIEFYFVFFCFYDDVQFLN